MPAPLVSVITASYQHAHLIGECLRSVQQQDYPAIEHIVVDDGSTDQTQAVVSAVGRPNVHYLYQVNQGQAEARQTGLDAASGQYVLLLDADDALLPRGIARLVREIEQSGDGGPRLVVGRALRTDGQLRPDGKVINKPFAVDPSTVLNGNPIGAIGGVLMRTADVHELGGLAIAGTAGAEDWDLWIRFFRADARFYFLRETVSLYRHSASSYSRNPLKMFQSVLGVLDSCRRPEPRLQKFGGELPLITEEGYRFLVTRMALYYLGIALALEIEESRLDLLLDRLDAGQLAAEPQLVAQVHRGASYVHLGGGGNPTATVAADLMRLLLTEFVLDRLTVRRLWNELLPDPPLVQRAARLFARAGRRLFGT